MTGPLDGPDGLAWHYTNGPGLLSILSSHTLWATSSAFLNDQQEVALGGELMVTRIRELARERGDEVFTSLAALMEAEVEGSRPAPLGQAHCYILSASRTWDSLAMWRLYGGAAESYAIGLDPTEALAALASHDVSLGGREDGVYLSHQAWEEVRYDSTDQRALVDDVLLSLPDSLARLEDVIAAGRDGAPGRPVLAPEQEELVERMLDRLQQALLLIKHAGFVDERETRYCVVFVAGHGSDRGKELEARLLAYRSTPYGIAPYLRLTGLPPERLEDDDPDNDVVPVTSVPARLPIRAVAISPSPNGEEATASLRQLMLAHGYDVPVLRSRIPFRG